MLAHYVNIGCAAFKFKRLARVNGSPVLNLNQLATMASGILTSASATATEFIELDFACFFAVERRAAVFSCQAVRDSVRFAQIVNFVCVCVQPITQSDG